MVAQSQMAVLLWRSFSFPFSKSPVPLLNVSLAHRITQSETCSVSLVSRTRLFELRSFSRTKSRFPWIWTLLSLLLTIVYFELAYLQFPPFPNYFSLGQNYLVLKSRTSLKNCSLKQKICRTNMKLVS